MATSGIPGTRSEDCVKVLNGRMRDLTGHRYGRWSVVSFSGRLNAKHNCIWLCRCDCGNTGEVPSNNLRGGDSKSCGCWQRERVKAQAIHNETRRGLKTPEYRLFADIHQRCGNPNNPSWKHYGGRGIRVCERWNSFSNFLADVGRRPTPDHSLDRYPNNNGNYEPGNVRWATREQQIKNRRISKSLESWSTEELLAELRRRRVHSFSSP